MVEKMERKANVCKEMKRGDWYCTGAKEIKIKGNYVIKVIDA